MSRSVSADEPPDSYAAVHRYDGAVLRHDKRDGIVDMAIQPRDFAIVLDVWGYKVLTAPMVQSCTGMARACGRHSGGCKMFNAGLLERSARCRGVARTRGPTPSASAGT
jgi:hypothetical protein